MIEKRQANAANKHRLRKARHMLLFSVGLVAVLMLVFMVSASASDFTVNIDAGDEAGSLGAIEVIAIFAFLSLLPAVLLMMTSFTRIIIVLSFMRSAMGTGQAPPNMVLTSLAIFLSLFIMGPVLAQMNETAVQPYLDGSMDGAAALQAAAVPVKKFMLEQTDTNSLQLFLNLSGTEVPPVADISNPEELLELPLTVITPAFMTSELSRAFWMGFLIYLPFLVIDMVVSSILMSMGMVMLPPAMISLPFKLLMFVLVDGWNLMMETLVISFRTA